MTRRLYRVQLTFPHPDSFAPRTRHYQSERSAQHRISKWLNDEFKDWPAALAPTATLTRSAPITWEAVVPS